MTSGLLITGNYEVVPVVIRAQGESSSISQAPPSAAIESETTPSASAGNANHNEILYSGKPLTWSHISEVIDELGQPTFSWEGGGVYVYDEQDANNNYVFFWDDGTGLLTRCSLPASALEVNGESLKKDRSGLVGLFGEPINQQWVDGEESSYLELTFNWKDTTIEFYLYDNSTPAHGLAINLTNPSNINTTSTANSDYSSEIIGSWRVSEGHEWHSDFIAYGEDIDFYADGRGEHSFNGRSITEFSWSAGISLETFYYDEPEEVEIFVLRMVYHDKEFRFYPYTVDSQLVLDQGAGPPIVLTRQ